MPKFPYQDLPECRASAGLQLLNGFTVLDLTTSVAGPYATMLLADMGARVIKVERPGGGDDSRAWGPPFLHEHSLWFLSVNRNKESIALDYSKEMGKKILLDLVARADVVMVNLVDRSLKKLGIDYDSIKKINAKIIYASITGFGLSGERKDLPCYDLIAEGYSGVMDLTGEPDSPPQKVGTPAADLIPGHDAALAVVAALLDRARSGQGHKIEISMVDSMVRLMSPRVVPYLGGGEIPRRTGAKDSVLAVYQLFETHDKPLTLALGNDAIWKRFWDALGEPDMVTVARFATNAKRRVARSEIVERIQEILLTKSRGEWLEVFRKANVPCGPVYGIEDLTNDAALLERGIFYQAKTSEGSIPQVGFGVVIDDVVSTYRSEPPCLGAHTDRVLDSLGYDQQTINGLRETGVVG